jgi:hypothetical protein
MSFTGSTFGKFTGNYLIIFGAFFVVLGVGAIVALGGLPYAGGSMWLMGGIFILVGGACVAAGIYMRRGAAATDQILTAGVAGTASITGVTQTGMYLNNQPQIRMELLVSLPGQAPYAAQHTEFVPLILLSRVSPGLSLPVRVNPADPSKVIIDWSGGAQMAPAMAGMAAPPPAPANMAGSGMDESLSQVQAALAGTGAAVPNPFASAEQGSYTVEQLRAWLRQNGLDAQARVDFIEDTGKMVGDERLYTMEMTLLVPGAAPEKLQRSAAMVPVGVSSKLVQGMTLPVKVAAENHHLLTVEWDKV